MNVVSLRIIIYSLCVLFLFTPNHIDAASLSFMGVGDIPGGRFFSQARGVSSNGTVVVGRSISGLDGDFEAFRWTKETGIVSLSDIPGSFSSSDAFATSDDGTVIVGTGNIDGDLTNGIGEAFRWTSDSGLTSLGFGGDSGADETSPRYYQTGESGTGEGRPLGTN